MVSLSSNKKKATKYKNHPTTCLTTSCIYEKRGITHMQHKTNRK